MRGVSKRLSTVYQISELTIHNNRDNIYLEREICINIDNISLY